MGILMRVRAGLIAVVLVVSVVVGVPWSPGGGEAAEAQAPVDAYASAVSADSPASWWRMEVPEGVDVPDEGSFGNALPGGSTSAVLDGASPALGQAMKGNWYVGQKPEYSLDEFTVEAWFRGGSGGGHRVFFRSWSFGMSLGVDDADRLIGDAYHAPRRVSNHDKVLSEQPVDDNRWHHAAFTRTTSELRLYLDGELVDVRVADGPAVAFSQEKVGVGQAGIGALLTLVWVADRREACGGWTEAVLSRSV
jgi:hypothetical protein